MAIIISGTTGIDMGNTLELVRTKRSEVSAFVRAKGEEV